MVNNYKPYDPNDDSERSSGASYVPTRREIKEKREELEEQRIVQESIDTSQPFVKPIEQERLEQQIRDQEVQLRNQESSAQLQADYLKTFATENITTLLNEEATALNIKKEISVSDKEKRMLELKNWLNELN